MITFHLSNHSGVPPYLQIVQQVRHALQVGILQEGDRLPTVKEVTAMVPINPNTVFKAYHELEAEGLVQGRTGLGTFVLRRPEGPPPDRLAALANDLSTWAARARAAGLDEAAMEAMVRAVIREGGNYETNN